MQTKLKVFGLIGNSGAGKSTFCEASRIVLENKLGLKTHYYHSRQPITDLLCKTFDVGEEYIEDKKRKLPFMRYLLQQTGDWVNANEKITVVMGMEIARQKALSSHADVLLIDGVRLYDQCVMVRNDFTGCLVKVFGGTGAYSHRTDLEWRKFAPDYVFDNTDKPRDIIDKCLVFWKEVLK